MDRTFRIYVLAVCFVSVVCLAITAGTGLYSLLKIAAPELTLDTQSYNAHQSTDSFRNSHFYGSRYQGEALFMQRTPGVARPMPQRQSDVLVNGEPGADRTPLSDAKVEQMRQESYRMLLKGHKRSAMQELIRAAIILFVSSILFFTHWRLIRSHSKENT